MKALFKKSDAAENEPVASGDKPEGGIGSKFSSAMSSAGAKVSSAGSKIQAGASSAFGSVKNAISKSGGAE